MEDVRSWLKQDFSGASETSVMPFWRTVAQFRPDIRVLVVRRPVADVVASVKRIVPGVDEADFNRRMRQRDAKLDQITARMPNVLSVNFADLATEATCAAAFEHCLPYKHDPVWWQALASANLQCSLPALMRYLAAHRPQIDQMVASVRQHTIAGMSRKLPALADGMTIQKETFDQSFPDAEKLFREHCVAVGEPPDQWERKNLRVLRKLDEIGALQIMTARSNGRMFGYLVTIVHPSLEDETVTGATNTTFFASPAVPGLGMKLQRAALAALEARGVSQVIMRAGVRASGPRMGVAYKRLGAEEFGQLYILKLKAA